MALVDRNVLIGKITKQKNPHPSKCDEIGGLIVEIDAMNYRRFLEKDSLSDYYVYFKDAPYGESLRPGTLLFFFVWDKRKPAINGYANIESCENLAIAEAWREGDRSHSTWDSSEPFACYFSERALRVKFAEMTCLSVEDERGIDILEIVGVFNACSSAALKKSKNKDVILSVFSPENMGNTYLSRTQASTLKSHLDRLGRKLTPGVTFSGSLMGASSSEGTVGKGRIDTQGIKHRIKELESKRTTCRESILKDYDKLESLENDQRDNSDQDVLFEKLTTQIKRLKEATEVKEQEVADIETELCILRASVDN